MGGTPDSAAPVQRRAACLGAGRGPHPGCLGGGGRLLPGQVHQRQQAQLRGALPIVAVQAPVQQLLLLRRGVVLTTETGLGLRAPGLAGLTCCPSSGTCGRRQLSALYRAALGTGLETERRGSGASPPPGHPHPSLHRADGVPSQRRTPQTPGVTGNKAEHSLRPGTPSDGGGAGAFGTPHGGQGGSRHPPAPTQPPALATLSKSLHADEEQHSSV